MINIHQFLPTLSIGDAISYEVLAIQDALKEWGYNSKIYVREYHPEVSKHCLNFKKYKPKDNDLIIFHLAIGSELSEFVTNLPAIKIMIYHNITPSNYFRGINETLAQIVKNGRQELASLHDKFDLALGDSEYNRKELEDLNFTNTGTLPLLYDPSYLDIQPSKKIIEAYDDNYTNIIFVGKIYPHKKQEDVIKAFYCYKKYINRKARLFLVGHCSETEIYQDKLIELIKELELTDVHITGFVNNADLGAYYRIADVFLSMSEHEGFCVPLLESMYFKIPIIAYRSTAIPYTLNNSAPLLREKYYLQFAELIDLIVTDTDLRNKIISKQLERLKEFDMEKTKNILKSHIQSFLS